MSNNGTALIVGVGDGLSASLARTFAAAGMRIALAARNVDKLAGLEKELDAAAFVCDATDVVQVNALFAAVADKLSEPQVVIYNPSYRTRGPIVELDPEAVRQTILVSAYGGFLVAQAAARSMLIKGSGSILFTGASASVKGYIHSAPFAMGKFCLRGLAQSMARELAPKNIHIAHFIIDGGIAKYGTKTEGDDRYLDPDAIARTYLSIHQQPPSAWTWEVELRPSVESF